MTRIAQHISHAVRSFLRGERASVSVEAVMIFPLLIWAYLGMFILYDGYRALSSNIRASYTVSDMLTRELNNVTPEYIAGLNEMVDILTQSPHRTVLRVTVASFYEGEHTLEWSHSTPGKSKVTEANFQEAIVDFLPPMPSGSEMIVVETWMAFVPMINITMEQLICVYKDDCDLDRVVFGPFYFESLVATRPRFAGQLKFDDGTS